MMDLTRSAPTSSLLTCSSGPNTAWTTVNISEAIPGVQVPLAWSLWSTAAERGLRRGFFDLGVLSRKELEAPDNADRRLTGVFFGNAAVNVDMFRELADRTPGSSGDAVERQLFGSVRPGMTSHRTYRRYPTAILKTPLTITRIRSRLLALRREVDPWWAANTAPEVLADRQGAAARFARGTEFFERAFTSHLAVRMLGQGMFDEVAKLAGVAGKPGLELELVTGYGSFEEVAMIGDLLDVAHGQADLAMFIGKHGFHGPKEGDLRSCSWREDPRPVERLAESYRRREPADLALAMAAQRDRRRRAEAELFAALPRQARPKARIVLRLARRLIPLGEVGKASFLMAFDVLRASARSHGRHLVDLGLLEEPDDIFMLTADEAFGRLPGEIDAVIASRRATIEEYETLRLPRQWVGQPVPDRSSVTGSGDDADIRGIAASPGVVTGTVRVIDDVAELADFEPGEVLVCKMTDPSWSSYMFVASAMVIDIGSAVSHGAILARELGVPCVTNTGDGTRRIPPGSRVQVDGGAGVVRILQDGAGS
jgi:pyruvate,water dikinase